VENEGLAPIVCVQLVPTERLTAAAAAAVDEDDDDGVDNPGWFHGRLHRRVRASTD